MSKDTRYVYGFCTWHDVIQKAGNTGPQKMNVGPPGGPMRQITSLGLPCCPYCGSMLREFPSEADYYKGADEYEKTHPGYTAFMKWMQGKCFVDMREAAGVYKAETGVTYSL